MLLPPASKGFVQLDQVGKSLLMDQNFVLLSLEEGALGVKQGEMAVDAMVVTRFRDGPDLTALLDQKIVFGYRPRDTHNIGLLKGIVADQ